MRPGVAFKAEAIVAPQQLVQYLGAHERFHPECDLAYNNQLMVLLWSSLATRDTTLARVALGRMRSAPPSTAWVTYLRCHDDIGWAVDDDDAAAVGLDGAAHRTAPGAHDERPAFERGHLPGREGGRRLPAPGPGETDRQGHPALAKRFLANWTASTAHEP
jgi:hypothetical protein